MDINSPLLPFISPPRSSPPTISLSFCRHQQIGRKRFITAVASRRVRSYFKLITTFSENNTSVAKKKKRKMKNLKYGNTISTFPCHHFLTHFNNKCAATREAQCCECTMGLVSNSRQHLKIRKWRFFYLHMQR